MDGWRTKAEAAQGRLEILGARCHHAAAALAAASWWVLCGHPRHYRAHGGRTKRCKKANRTLEKEVQERKNAQQLLVDSEQSLRLLSRHLMRSQDEERKRIGRELHDSVGLHLVVLKMNLDSIRSSGMADRQTVAQQVGRCSDLAEQCIAERSPISSSIGGYRRYEIVRTSLMHCSARSLHRPGPTCCATVCRSAIPEDRIESRFIFSTARYCPTLSCSSRPIRLRSSS